MKLFGKRTDKKKPVVPTEMPRTGIVTSVAIEEARKFHFRLPKIRLPHPNLKRFLPSKRVLTVLAIVVGLGLVITGGMLGYKAWKERPHKVGDYAIGKKDLTAAEAAQKKALEAAGEKDVTAEKAKKAAQDQLILLAGLKTEADKQKITYGEADIDGFLQDSFKRHDGKQGYLDYVQRTYSWTKEDLYRQQTIMYLESKLGGSLISTRTYSMMFVRWDNLKNAYAPDEYAKIYAQKEKQLKEQYLPLFQQKASTDQLAKAAELLDSMSQEQQMKIYEAKQGAPVTYNLITHGVNNPSSGYAKYDEGEDMHTKLVSIKNEGDYIGPFKSASGILTIVRLEKNEGGPYNTWEEFTDHYRKISGIAGAPSSIVQQTVHLAGYVFHSETAYAAENCLSSHRLDYRIHWRDNATGAAISSASSSVYASTNRSASLCNKSNYSSNGYTVGSGTSSYSVSKTFYDDNAGNMTVILDCNGPSWSISNTNDGVNIGISGYNYSHTDYPPGRSNAYPYFSGANGSPAFHTYVYYDKAPPPTSTVQIHVFKARTDNTGTYTNVSGATTAGNCGTSTSAMTTGSNGMASRSMNNGDGLCLRITSAAPSVAQYQSIAGPYVRPWGEGYGSGCGNYSGNSNYTAHCGSGSYECQRVGVKDSSTCGNSNVDRASDGGFDFVYVITPAPTPSCSISANPNPMNEGETTTISWSSSYATSMSITKNGSAWAGGTSGSRSDNPTSTVTYRGTVSNADGSGSCSTVVTVIPLPRCTISVSPTSYVGGGSNSTTVSWSSTNASNVTVYRGSTYFASGVSGSQTDNQQAPNTYNYNGTATIVGARNITLSTTCSANLVVYPEPGCSASPSYPAPNDTVTYTATGGDPAKPYNWSTGYTGNPYSTTYASAGVYTVSVTNGGVTRSCSATVVNKPYHRVFGGDTLAGVGFAATDSTCPGTSVISGKRQIGFNRNMGGGYTGGGNSHANIATGAIVDFVSGMLEGAPYGPRTFAISNTSGFYGGSLSTGSLATACANNYYSKLPSATTGLGSPAGVPAADGDYSFSGNMTLSGGNVPAGVRATIYVNGNVFISGNITYANSGAYGTNPTQIPSFKLVVNGNIYVGANVSELNGIYVAQPNGASGGAFYTCGFDRGGGTFTGPSGSGSPYTSSELTNTCATNQLTVYGAVVAKDVMLHRTRNTLPNAPEAFPGANAAERFIYTPDTWFNGDPSISKPFQAYTALPSIF